MEDLLVHLRNASDDGVSSSLDEDLERFQQDDFMQQALSQGVDLRGYARDVERELREVEMESVREYLLQSGSLMELHDEIQGCDAILARMQEMLLGFQADLGGISDEIKHLQDESISMNIKLKNRKAAEQRLSLYLENVVVPGSLAGAICGGTMNESYLECIKLLNSKVRYVTEEDASCQSDCLGLAPAETLAAREAKPHLKILQIKACSKARDYLLLRIAELRKPKTNIQIIQRSSLLKYKYLTQFLSEHAPAMAEEVQRVYVESMARTIYNLFRAYYNQLAKLEVTVATKQDLIAVEETGMRGLFSSKGQGHPNKARDAAFSLGTRDSVLNQIEAAPILVHVAQAEGMHVPYEVILRSVLKHLVDSATSEYLFTLEFFKGTSEAAFQQIFGRTLGLCLENLDNFIPSCHDAIGLVLMIKIAYAHRMVMQRRRIPALDGFFDQVNMKLWPRFKMLFAANLRSISAANPKRLGAVDLKPHLVIKRYAEFCASLLVLHSGLDSLVAGVGGEEMLLNDLTAMRTEVVKLLQRLSERLPAEKQRLIFLINNYDQVLSVFAERRIISDETTRFEDLLSETRELFVEEELKQRYPQMLAFVQQSEATLAAGKPLQVDEAHVAGMVRDFSLSWKAGLEGINQAVLAYFANSRNGMEILKQVLTQLLLYYTRLQEVIKQAWPRPPAFCKNLVPTASILTEVKKYAAHGA
ncbi:unnamed protein product [Chrysoparadoxa australica]